MSAAMACATPVSGWAVQTGVPLTSVTPESRTVTLIVAVSPLPFGVGAISEVWREPSAFRASAAVDAPGHSGAPAIAERSRHFDCVVREEPPLGARTALYQCNAAHWHWSCPGSVDT